MTFPQGHIIIEITKRLFAEKKEGKQMKKRLFKIAALVGLAAMMVVGMAGCKKTVCEWCGEEAHCKTVYLSLLGDYNMCKECEKLVAPISENLEEFDQQENGK